MREEKDLVSTDLRRLKAQSREPGMLGFMWEYTKEVVKLYEERREYYNENVNERNDEGHKGTMERLKEGK